MIGAASAFSTDGRRAVTLRTVHRRVAHLVALIALALATAAPVASITAAVTERPTHNAAGASKFVAAIPATSAVAAIRSDDVPTLGAIERRIDAQHLGWVAVLVAALVVMATRRRYRLGVVHSRQQSQLIARPSGRSPPSPRAFLTI